MNRKGALFVVMAMVAVMTFFSTTGCSDKKPSTQDTAVSTTDSVSAVTDTMETIIAEAPMPRAADELLDDFIFNFAANKKLQFKRIHFPLPLCVAAIQRMCLLISGRWNTFLCNKIIIP